MRTLQSLALPEFLSSFVSTQSLQRQILKNCEADDCHPYSDYKHIWTEKYSQSVPLSPIPINKACGISQCCIRLRPHTDQQDDRHDTSDQLVSLLSTNSNARELPAHMTLSTGNTSSTVMHYTSPSEKIPTLRRKIMFHIQFC